MTSELFKKHKIEVNEREYEEIMWGLLVTEKDYRKVLSKIDESDYHAHGYWSLRIRIVNDIMSSLSDQWARRND